MGVRAERNFLYLSRFPSVLSTWAKLLVKMSYLALLDFFNIDLPSLDSISILDVIACVAAPKLPLNEAKTARKHSRSVGSSSVTTTTFYFFHGICRFRCFVLVNFCRFIFPLVSDVTLFTNLLGAFGDVATFQIQSQSVDVIIDIVLCLTTHVHHVDSDNCKELVVLS